MLLNRCSPAGKGALFGEKITSLSFSNHKSFVLSGSFNIPDNKIDFKCNLKQIYRANKANKMFPIPCESFGEFEGNEAYFHIVKKPYANKHTTVFMAKHGECVY